MDRTLASLDIFDYGGNKICGLYDSQNDLFGQAYDISFSKNMTDGIKELTFSIPYVCVTPPRDSIAWKDVLKKTWNEVNQGLWGDIMTYFDRDLNFRWNYLKSEYLIRLNYNGEIQWYIAKKPTKQKSGKEIIGTVSCKGLEATLKTKNIYMEFDDSNGIGTANELLDKILMGSGWHRGETDTIYEEDGVTEKVRSITSGDKQGALGLIVKLCNLFKCYPEFDSDHKLVSLRGFKIRDQILEGEVGKNMDSLSVSCNSDDIITRLYCEGEYGTNGYVGIDSANPTGLNYIMNFDYFREIGVMTSAHEYALNKYIQDISAKKQQITANVSQTTQVANEINGLIGQCKMALYYVSSGYTTPYYEYGVMTDEQKALNVGDKVVVLNTNGTFRYATIETTPSALIQSGDYGIAKFVTGAAGSIGSKEVAIETKEKMIEDLQRKIAATTKADKIAEYNAEIEELEIQIQSIYNDLYMLMDGLMKNSSGLIPNIKTLEDRYDVLNAQQDDIEATFIAAMGDLLRDGYWPCKDYIPGQEEHFYNDAVERLKILSKPIVSYQFNYVRLSNDFDVPLEDFQLNAFLRINDDDLQVHDNVFITKITIGVDDLSNGTITVSNQDITISANDLGSLLSRMSQLADLIEQKNTVYERAKAISKTGTFFTDLLNGTINVMTNQIMSTVSNWYTDDRGNIMFVSADGGSAMMLTGAGWMIASSKDDAGEWVWRTAATGYGLTADVITAGFISAERIESNSISTNHLEPNVGSTLVISGNPTITNINNQIAPEFDTGTTYEIGDLVRKDGVLYVFTRRHPAGAWNTSHVSRTDVTTQIELMPDKIISYVGTKGYGRTFYSETDPALDPTNEVHNGDYWVKQTRATNTWQTLKDTKHWSDLQSLTWYDLLDVVPEMYLRHDNAWIPVSDKAAITEAYTRIEQTADQIKSEAYRASQAEGELQSTIVQTADSIISTVSQTYLAKTSDYETVNAIIDESIRLAENAATSAKDASIAKTEVYQSAEAIVSTAVAVSTTNIAPEFSTSQTYEIGDIVSYNGKVYKFKVRHPAGAWNASHVDEATAQGTFIAKTTQYQTADAIVTEAVKSSAGNMAPAFSTSKAYAIGDIVSYNGKVYKFKATHAAGAWNANHVDEVTTASALVDTATSIAQDKADAAAESAKNASIAKTSTYTSAASIVNSAVAVYAPAFSTSKAYVIGDVVSYNGKIYRFKAAHSAGAWNANHVDEVTAMEATDGMYIAQTNVYQTADAIVTEAVKSSASRMAPAFSTSTTYAVGDIVSYNGKVYKFKTAHSAGAWNASHVDEVTTASALVDTATSIAQDKADAAAESAKNASIAKTSTYTSAASIVNSAVAVYAPAFSTSTAYAIGDVVSYSGKIYRFKVAHAAGAWNASHVDAVTAMEATDGMYIAQTNVYQTADAIVTEAVKSSAGRMAPAFSTSKAYAVGDIVSYNGKVYKFKTAHSAGAWNASHVDEVATSDALISIAQEKADAAATSAKNASIAKTSTYTSAASIVNSAVAVYAPAFSTSKDYAIGDVVSYNGKIYRFKAAHSAGDWNSSHVDAVTAMEATDGMYIAQTNTYQTADAIVTEAVKSSAGRMAPAFSTTKAYAIGDVVSYNGKVYKFKSAHSAGAWNASHVDEVTTASALIDIAQEKADAAAESAKDASIAKTSTYTSAASIVNSAVAVYAPAFSTSTAYAIGDVVTRNGKIYRFKAAHAAGSWNASHVDEVTAMEATDGMYIAQTNTYQTADAIVMEATKTSAKSVAPAFSTSTSYSVGAIVSYNGKVYKFKTAHSAGAWNSSHVDEINISDNAYKIVSGITINSNGIVMTGSKYISLASSGYVSINNFTFDQKGISYRDPNDASLLRIGHNAAISDAAVAYSMTDMQEILSGVTYHNKTALIRASYYYPNEIDVNYLQPNELAFNYFHDTQEWHLWGMRSSSPISLGRPALSGSSAHAYWFQNGYIKNVNYETLVQNSSRDMKHNIVGLQDYGDTIDRLNAVSFKYNDDTTDRTRFGLIYEDTIDLIPEICIENGSGKGIDYVELIPILLNEIQSLRKRVKQLEG